MDTRYLETFAIAAEYLSFTRAAKLLGYTQSTVSFQIRQLEQEMGCRLFDRINHRITITQEGQKFLDYARAVLKSTNELKEDFIKEKEVRGRINIATSDSICEVLMMNHYREFHARYPGIEIGFYTSSTVEILDALDHNKTDLVFTLDSHIYKPDYMIVKEEPVALHFVTSPFSPLANSENISIRDVVGHPFFLTEKGLSYRQELEERLSMLQQTIDPILEMGRTDLICKCLEDSDAVSYLPDFVTEPFVQAGKLVRLDLEELDIQIWKQLIYHKNKWLSAPLRIVIDYLKEKAFV